MASILLPPAIAAKGFVDSAIPLHTTAIAAANGYPGAVAGAVTALSSAVTSITAIQTALIPSGAIAPPSKIGVNITGAILTQLSTVLAAITTAGVAAPLLPEPASTTTFGTATGTVTTQLPIISAAITTGLIIPQQV
jgi:hypothetical protein|tara:strand:+ start:235 stop:645 length:411 start_codon:yes stop_codon:yes gene_type:complete